MAYTYVSAVARTRDADADWDSVDLNAISITDLYKNYYKVWVTLANSFFGSTPLYLDLDVLRTTIGGLFNGVTLPQWLVTNGNATLPTTTTAPALGKTPARYKDAWIAGYTIIPSDHTRSIDEVIPEPDKIDLYMTKDGVDYSMFETHALVSVNGLIHRSGGSGTSEGIYVIKGADSWRRANDSQVGIFSFANVASLQQVPITLDMLYKNAPNQSLKNYAYINLGQSVVGKTVLFVLGGYLHVLDSTYMAVGDGLFRIDFNNYPLIERIIESGKIIDLSTLSLETTTNNPDQIGIADAYSDGVLSAYLTLPQSFAVIIDTPSMYATRRLLEPTKFPGRYFGYQPYDFPLIVGHGQFADYRLSYDDGTYIYSCADNLTNRYRFLTTGWRNQTSVDSSRLSDRPVEYSPGTLLEVGSFDS